MITSRKTAIDAISTIAAATEDLAVLSNLKRVRSRLGAKSMDRILDLVPGDSVAAKCKIIGISRTTYYMWLDGVTRPRGKDILARLAAITRVSADEIRGA